MNRFQSKKSKFFDYENTLRHVIKIRRPILFIQTDDYVTEEERLIRIFRDDDINMLKSVEKVDINIWSFERGKRVFLDDKDAYQPELLDCLSAMLSLQVPSILIIRGLYYYMGGLNNYNSEVSPNIISLLYDFYYENESKELLNKSMVIIESPKFDMPPELRNCVFTIEPPLPNSFDILEELGLNDIDDKYDSKDLKDYYQAEGKPYRFSETFFQSAEGDVYSQNKKKLVSILNGMNVLQIRTLLSYNDYLIEDTALTNFRKSKERMVKDSGLLRVEDVPNRYYEFVGDIDGLMKYVEREKTVIDNRINYNSKMPMPKGLLLVGPPGCGKSETSKAIASKLEMPLYSLDMGRLLGNLMGDSEHNFEKAISIAEAAQPCVLRIDEIEKAFAGSGTQNNSETLTRIVGYFLTWMQDRKSLVYIVATANNLDQLRPEFLRKGRWDEIFYLSYPKADGMIKILNSCLKRYSLKFDDKDTVEREIKLFYNTKPDVNVSGAEVYDLVEQIYKQLFQRNPQSCGNIISAELFARSLFLYKDKRIDVDVQKMVDAEMLEIRKEFAMKPNSGERKKKLMEILKSKYSESFIDKLINDELISYEIHSLLGGNTLSSEKKEKIQVLLRKKYDMNVLIEEEYSNIELNNCLHSSDGLEPECENEIKKILFQKYKSNYTEEEYVQKGYKSASTWKCPIE